MSNTRRLKNLLDAAKGKEKSYDWTEAAKFYVQALEAVRTQDLLKKGAMQEQIGHCLHRAAFQAESQEAFKDRMRQAIDSYNQACAIYSEMTGEQNTARVLRCRAIVKYLEYWLAARPSEKRVLLRECLELEGQALTAFIQAGEVLEYGKTYGALPLVFLCSAFLEWNRLTAQKIVEKGVEWGEKAVAALSGLEASCELAKAYLIMGSCLTYSFEIYMAEPNEADKNRSKAVEYLGKAVGFSEKVGNAYLSGLCHIHLAEQHVTGGEEGRLHSEKALEYSKLARDNFLMAASLRAVRYNNNIALIGLTEDPEKRRELVEKALQIYEKMQHHRAIISFTDPRAPGEGGHPFSYVWYYFNLADMETDREKRRELFEKCEKAGVEALRLAEDSDIPWGLWTGHHVLSRTLEMRARMETDREKKKGLLKRALEHEEQVVEIEARVYIPLWSRGMIQKSLANIKAELADFEPDDGKRRLLEDAVLNMEAFVKLCNKAVEFYEKRGELHLLAAFQWHLDAYASILMHLYSFSHEPEHLKKTIEISQKAIQAARKADMISLVAESYWRLASAQDLLTQHVEAADSFAYASESYTKVAEKIPQLEGFYQEHASYMQAWSEIEKARYHHTEKHYKQAKENYANAAKLHESTKRWSHLSSNYVAWARLEEAEDLSRRQETKESKDLFKQATNLFAEAKKLMQAKLESLEAGEMQAMVAELVNASDTRQEYCKGRMALEDAKILDRQGDHASSSRQYGAAAERFQQILNALERPRDRQELQPILHLTRAWQMMTRAEAEASPSFYLEAAKLFERAKKHSTDEKTKLLAVGHSRFCQALEVGARFEATRDVALYPTAKKHLEAAAGLYFKAGFKTASQYAIATRRLLDAYLHMTEAETETDPGRKVQRYEIAERLLQASAGSFVKAKHPEKEKQLHRLLEGVKEERQLVMSLTKLVHAPAIIASTTAFSTPSPTHETPAGLDRFEHAYIGARVYVPEEFIPGEEFQVKLDLANAGTKPGLLVRIEGVVPPRCKVLRMPSNCALEGASLNMRGKRLEPLCVESVSIRVQIPDVAHVSLSPQVVYVDELGNFRTTRLEEVKILPVVEFESEVAQDIFNYLIKAFVEDRAKRRLGVERSGWRSFPQIIKGARVSKRSLYGSGGRLGHALSELQRKRLVNLETFLGERGRGGQVLKVRIHHKKESVKRYVKEKAPNLLT